MSADKQLKAYIDRVLRLKEEQDTLGDDIREVYAEAKAEGYDKTIMGKLVAHLRKVQKSGEDAVSEQEMNFDTYLQAYHRASGTAVATHTHEEKFDPATGELLHDKEVNPRLIQQVVTGMQTETGRAALIAAVDIMIEREEAEEFQAKASGDNGATGQADEEAADSMTGDASRTSRGVDTPATNSPSDDDAFAAVKGNARLANVADVEPSSSAPIASASHGEAEAPSAERVSPAEGGSAAANTGGYHVDPDHSHAATAGTRINHIVPATKPKTARDFRPNCLKPDACGASGLSHCYSCTKAMQKSEEFA